jgi:sialate O-acetylesterase
MPVSGTLNFSLLSNISLYLIKERITMRIILLPLLMLIFSSTIGQIRLPRLISDGMIIQRDTKTKVWGWASPGEEITISFKGKLYKTITNKDGMWTIFLSPQKAGGPYTMTFSASNDMEVNDIYFGDVWLCSGQSNMELTMERVRYKYAAEIETIDNPRIRQFEVPDRYNFKQAEEDVLSGQWISATPENIRKFSAVAYFFANELYQTYQVPIGLINSALGGSPAEAWISEGALKQFPVYYNEALYFKNDSNITQIEAHDRKLQNSWYSRLNNSDLGLKQHWSNPSLDDSHWPEMSLPGYWADKGLEQTNGVVWFRKEITLPNYMVSQPAEILLGCIVDADSVFINGHFVGTTTYQYPPRRYSIPANVLREGKNQITIRVVNHAGKGGFVLDKPYQVQVGNHVIDLKGNWKYKLGAALETLPGQTFIRWKPLGLYNAMIAPLINYTIKGAIWYQGESNTKAPSEYTALMTTLINDWRAKWGQGSFPFLFVQLANFMEAKQEPSQSNWAELRQAQLETLTVPNTAMAVTIDLGEWNDIHPLNKQDVGKRLALQAKRLAYGNKKIIASGPVFQSIERKGNCLVISFDHAGSGLRAVSKKSLKHFAIAGVDKNFVWANAKIEGNKVVIWNDVISNPVTVRYAWADNPAGANLYNKEMLPATPFEATIRLPKQTAPITSKDKTSPTSTK